jgi:hypothetical protein
MKLKTILLAALAAWAGGAARGAAQEAASVAQAVSDQIASLASYTTNFAPGCANPIPAENTCCTDGGCGQCSHCNRRMDVWGSAEFLLWWTKGSYAPPLVTTSPAGTGQGSAGVLPGAEVLFGQSHLGDEDQAGGRVTLGLWLDDEHNVSVVGRVYGLGGASDRFEDESDGTPILARPFRNALIGQNDALLVAFPGLSTGSIDASLVNNFYAAETYFQVMVESNQNRRVDVIAGYQFARLDDWLDVRSVSEVATLGGAIVDIRDRFSTQNEFHGGQFGLRGQMMRGCWSLDALAKVGIGVTRQRVTIDGRTLIDGAASNGGLLAQESNIGTFQRDKFAYIPELTLNLRYHFNPCVSMHVGYSLIYMSDVVTAGRQIDTSVNLSQQTGPIVGQERPLFAFEDEYYWLQGINFGVNWDF